MFRSLLAIVVVALAHALPASAAAPEPVPPKKPYSQADAWLCRPGRADACAADLTATVVRADGSTSVEAFKADPKAPIDCFFVYPTISRDSGTLSDMDAGPEEKGVAEVQAARFASRCRLYAPIYRQWTITALLKQRGAPMSPSARPRESFEDVAEAWRYYLANDNHGRGVVLIGHSQGSGLLMQLLKQEIEGKPAQKRLVSAILMGTALPVTEGQDTGYLQTIPLCRSASQIGCAIAYASFRDTVPPSADALFGRPREPTPGMVAACVNPANLGGGEGELHPYMSNGKRFAAPAEGFAWTRTAAVTTPYVSAPGLLSAKCAVVGDAHVLQVHVRADPADPRTDDIPGDLPGPDRKPDPRWGLHMVDANLALGDLVEIVGAQSRAYLARK
jgi:hypothetical protein